MVKALGLSQTLKYEVHYCSAVTECSTTTKQRKHKFHIISSDSADLTVIVIIVFM